MNSALCRVVGTMFYSCELSTEGLKINNNNNNLIKWTNAREHYLKLLLIAFLQQTFQPMTKVHWAKTNSTGNPKSGYAALV